jgi:sugar (pentulose or hexulose) kinase
LDKNDIQNGRTALGLEFGSTRIKAVLIDGNFHTLAAGEHNWENRFENGLWTYSLDEVWRGARSCYAALKKDVLAKYGVVLRKIGAVGISAMMHGYLAFDKDGGLLTPFRTWRNNNAEPAARELTALFGYNIPARWSIAHLYQAIKDGEPRVGDIDFLTTLAGYAHWQLTGEKAVGIGDASGMFPIGAGTREYDGRRAALFEAAAGKYGFGRGLADLFPRVLSAGRPAGALTEEGARLLDPSGELQAGIPFCPPEGDAGTGMAATNSVRRGTGNVSAGTSVFGMAVLDREPSKAYPEIDIVATPSGAPVAMAHCNNCTSEINAWVGLFEEYNELFGFAAGKDELYGKLFSAAQEGEPDCGGLLVYNYLSGENITGIDEGRPLFLRTTESAFTLKNFMRAQLYSAFATLKIGFDILRGNEKIKMGHINAHGGIFKTTGAAQRFLAAALDTPVTVSETAGGGGAWGMALLAAYMTGGNGMELEDYLDEKVFKNAEAETVMPDPRDVAGFERFMSNYKRGLSVVKQAVTALKRGRG